MLEPVRTTHFDAPWFFFFLRAVRHSESRRLRLSNALSIERISTPGDFAWFMFAIFLLSTSTASYTFILLLLPITLLLSDCVPWKRVIFITAIILLNAPLKPARLFPKVWLLLALFAMVGWEYWRSIKVKWLILTAAVGVLAAIVDASIQMRSFQDEPARHYQRIATEPGSLFSSFPAITRDGLFYQGLSGDRYVLFWLHDGRLERFPFDGQVFHPVAPNPHGPVCGLNLFTIELQR